MSQLTRGLAPVLLTVALVAAFGVILFLTVRYTSDCRSHR